MSLIAIPDHTIEVLADIAAVPNDHRARIQFGLNVRKAISASWSWTGPRLPLRARETKSSLVRFHRAAAELRDALQTCGKAAETLIDASLSDLIEISPDLWDRLQSLNQFSVSDYKLVALLLVRAAHGALALQRKPPRLSRPGRKPRISRNAFLRVFVDLLLTAVAEAGGRLTFNKEKGGKGSLVDILNELRPFLRENFLPRTLPIATLERVLLDNRSRQRAQHRSSAKLHDRNRASETRAKLQ